MAVNVNDKKIMLKTVTSNTNPDGTVKKRSITVRNIDNLCFVQGRWVFS